jgi:hypothetical protein
MVKVIVLGYICSIIYSEIPLFFFFFFFPKMKQIMLINWENILEG